MTNIDINKYLNKVEDDKLPAQDWNELHEILQDKTNELVAASNELNNLVSILREKVSTQDWSKTFFNSSSKGRSLHAGDTYTATVVGNYAVFSLNKSALLVNFSQVDGSTVAGYSVVNDDPALVPVLWVNIDNPEIVAVDNVRIESSDEHELVSDGEVSEQLAE